MKGNILFRGFVTFCLVVGFSLCCSAWAAQGGDEAPAPLPAKVGKVDVREFPPLPPKRPTVEESVNNLSIALFDLKNEFWEYMNATEERRKVLEFFDKISNDYASFKADPRGFLMKIGVEDEEVLSAADKYIGINENRLQWHEKLGVGARILSCMSVQDNGDIMTGLEVKIPAHHYLKQAYNTSPLLDFKGSTNVTNITFTGMFPKTFANGNIGYNGRFVLPFVIKAEQIQKPISLGVALNGQLCETKTGECRILNLALTREFDANSRIASPECGVIKDFYRRHRGDDEIRIVIAKWDKDVLKIQAEVEETFDNPSLIIQSADNLIFDTPRITYDDGVLKAAAKVKNPENAYGKPLHITFGYPYYFTIAELVPQTGSDDVITQKNTSLPLAFIDGIGLVFFSPLLALLLFLLIKSKQEIIIRQSAFAAGVVAFVYPLLGLIFGKWGEQFTSPAFTFACALMMIAAGFYLLKAINLRWAGIIFAILSYFAPVHFIGDTVDYAGWLGYIFMAAGVFIGFAIPVMILAPMRTITPEPLKVLGKAIVSNRRYSYIVMGIQTIFAVWLASIAFVLAFSWWQALLCIFIMLCFAKALQLKIYKTAFVFFVLGVLILPFAKVTVADNFSSANVSKAINDGKIVYAVVDTPWCLSCQFGKGSFMTSGLVRSMIANKDMIVLRASPDNPEIVKIADAFSMETMPMHMLYTKDRQNGEIMPWFIQNYNAVKQLKKVNALDNRGK